MPKVSVVTGYYNRAAVLERTISSVLGQTFRDLDLVVFDDRSTDDTAAALRELSEQYDDPRFRYVIHETNKGFVTGLRDAISETSGDYIAIQGSGDVSLPRRLERQVEFLDSHPDVGAVGCWYHNVQEDLGTRRLRTPVADSMTFEDLLGANVYSHGEVVIRRSVYEQVGGYRTAFRFSQDRDLWLRIAKVARLATVPEPLYDRYVQFDGVSYVPSKVVTQTCFSIAAARLAVLPAVEERAALQLIESEGPAAFVGVDDPVVQGKLRQASLRMVLFGSPEGGAEIAQKYLEVGVVRTFLVAMARFFDSPFSRPIRPLIRRAAGMRSEK